MAGMGQRYFNEVCDPSCLSLTLSNTTTHITLLSRHGGTSFSMGSVSESFALYVIPLSDDMGCTYRRLAVRAQRKEAV